MSNFLDARTDDLGEQVTADVCIVGAGAAGITLASNLAAGQLRVVLLESGGMELDGQTQQLYQGLNVGLPYYDLLACRLRYFGGTTNHWAGYCRANDPEDYVGRPALDVPAWPVGEAEISPYIATAAKQLGIAPEGFDAAFHLQQLGLPPEVLLESRSDKFVTKVFQISRRKKFQELYKDELESFDSLQILLNSNVTHIQLRDSGQTVDHLRIETLTGKTARVTARYYVLACHGIENSRLLLVSNDVQSKGIGNDSDHVGRYFMEHPHIFGSRLIPAPGAFPDFYNYEILKRINLNANLSLSAEVLFEEQILQYYCRFNPIYRTDNVAGALRNLRRGAMKPFDPELVDDVATLLGDIGATAEAVADRLGIDEEHPLYFELEHRIEQAANPESRVVLSDQLDRFGKPRADLHWALNEVDFRTFQRGQEIVVQELSALGLGRFEVTELTPDYIREGVLGHYHHIGTTRMSEGPEDGVIDRNCRVHGVENLFIAGSSIYPSAGYSGPSMVLIGFAIRLAEHLSSLGRA